MLGDHIMGVLNGWNITLKCISNFHPPILLQHIKWLGLQIEIETTNQVASHHLSMTKTHPTRCSLNKATKRHKNGFLNWHSVGGFRAIFWRCQVSNSSAERVNEPSRSRLTKSSKQAFTCTGNKHVKNGLDWKLAVDSCSWSRCLLHIHII